MKKSLMHSLKAAMITVYCAISVFHSFAEGTGNILFREDFESLEQWETVTFPKIKQHTDYSIIKTRDGGILKAYSNSSASGLVLDRVFNVYDFPVLAWRWKIDNIYSGSGDDYPLRIYVMFEFRPEKSSFLNKLKYNSIRLIYGKYPPHSSINYVWNSRDESPEIMPSPYADKVMLISLQKGGSAAGIWKEEKIDIVADYIRSFGQNPPANASIGIMNDSDDTGEASSSYIDYIEIRKNR